jgi:hypothetical protein
MNSRIGADQADQLIEQKLQRSVQLHEAMERTLGLHDDELAIADLHGTDIATASIGLSMEHGDSLLVLMARGNPNTATATLRMQFESLLRGAWAVYAATQQEIEALERELTVEADAQARKVAVYGDMLKALRKEGCNAPRVLVDEVGRVDRVLRHSLNSFVHGGFQPLKRHSEGFPQLLVLQVIETSNAISTMAAALFAVLIADEGHRLSRLNALIPEFWGVLPELTIVQKHAPQR